LHRFAQIFAHHAKEICENPFNLWLLFCLVL
jgi:hypothetical protein